MFVLSRNIGLFLILLILIPPSSIATPPEEVKVGGILPEAKMYGFAGDFRWFSEFRGKPLIINVWASWCGPCRSEMGSLESLSRQYGGKQFNIIGISTDDDSNAAYRFLMNTKTTFDNYLDYKLTFEKMLGAYTIPLTILVDANGKVLKKVRGARRWDSPDTIKMIGETFNVEF